MKESFIANIHTKKIHSLAYADKRCKIDAMREEYKMGFCTLEEALAYPGNGRGVFHECGCCMPKYHKAVVKK